MYLSRINAYLYRIFTDFLIELYRNLSATETSTPESSEHQSLAHVRGHCSTRREEEVFLAVKIKQSG